MHSSNVLVRIVAKPRYALRIAAVVALGRGLVKPRRGREVALKPVQLLPSSSAIHSAYIAPFAKVVDRAEDAIINARVWVLG